LDVEGRLEPISRVSPSPVDNGVKQREKEILPNKNAAINFQLNSLGGPLEEDFSKE